MEKVAIEDRKYTEEEYFNILENSGPKLEYHDGFIREMAFEFDEVIVGTNIQVALHRAFYEKDCSVFASQLLTYVKSANRFYFPDTSVVCGKVDAGYNDLFIKNPSLIVEVAAKSTANFDKDVKMLHYFSIPSLQEYIVIDADRPLVIVHSKNEKGAFETSGVTGLNGEVFLSNFAVKLNMRDIYQRMKF